MKYCPKCNSEYREGFDLCSDCNIPLLEKPTPKDSSNLTEKNEINNFYALRTVASILKVLAWIWAIFTIIGFIVIIGQSHQEGLFGVSSGGPNILLALFSLFIGAIVFLFFYAISESILVIIAIEENTRKISEKT
ncbi:MAG: hypothetical protein MUO31_09960 [Thermodesulfovibrionales bacterium]|nr:hypothetical protein [Thermodesulfovibrionales bacterium]